MATTECAICHISMSNGQATVKLREKGSDSINSASIERCLSVKMVPGQSVYVECRKAFCNKIAINLEKRKRDTSEENESRTLRSVLKIFSFKTHCLFCGEVAALNERGATAFAVRTLEFQNKIETICKERSDKWSDEVRCRLESIHDLPAADAVYHQSCSTNFRTGKQIPLSFQAGNEKRMKQTQGRPKNVQQLEAFLQVSQFLVENDDEQITPGDLVAKMKDICEDAFSVVYMKKKLKEKFGSEIVFTEIIGKPNVVTFRHTVSSILQTFYERQKEQNPDAEKIDIIKTAAQLILSDIKRVDASKDIYPQPNELSSITENTAFLPPCLRLFLETIFSEKSADLKVASIGQAIMQAARPRVLIAPLQLGLGVQMHHSYASKFLVETLHKL